MSPTQEGALVLIVTLAMLLSGVPVAFGLGAVSIVFLLIFQGFDALQVVAETFYSGLNEFTLVSIPMFVMMGAAIGTSPAGKDLYEALDRWLYRLPGGLVISNLGACAIFAALTGSSPACCAAIGKMGIPEMRKRGYPDGIATGSICAGGTLGILIPPSITFILYGIATETSIGRLFLAGVMPGLLLTGLFMLWTLFAIWKSGFRAHAPHFRYSWRQKLESVPKVAPFLLIVIGVMYVLYGGVATPSEAAGVGHGVPAGRPDGRPPAASASAGATPGQDGTCPAGARLPEPRRSGRSSASTSPTSLRTSATTEAMLRERSVPRSCGMTQ